MTREERIEYLVKSLELNQHPEGGFYKETYRSVDQTNTPAGKRNLCTVIYFLLTSENVSKFHQIKSDEHWFWHEGSTLSIHLLEKNEHRILKLGAIGNENTFPQQVVPAHTIFGSTVDEENSYALVSCVVAPGFDFEDFKLFTSEELLKNFPSSQRIIEQLT